MKSHIAFTIGCVLTLITGGAACAHRGAPPPERISSEGTSQSDMGKQIVSDTQRDTETGQTQDQEIIRDQQIVNQQLGPEGNAMGVPEPGTVSDQESTIKQRNPARQQSAEDNAQVTMGGGKPLVSGEVLRIDGDNYFVRDQESGEEVKLVVNTDTNLDCGAAGNAGQGDTTMSTDRKQDQSSDATQRQQTQGQRGNETAAGSGFAVGGCAFQQGDHVKAEVSDLGTVTTLKAVSPESQQAPSSSVKIEGTN
jgi:hypothetical protein